MIGNAGAPLPVLIKNAGRRERMVLAAFGADGKEQFRYAGGEAFRRTADFHGHQSSVGHGGHRREAPQPPSRCRRARDRHVSSAGSRRRRSRSAQLLFPLVSARTYTWLSPVSVETYASQRPFGETRPSVSSRPNERHRFEVARARDLHEIQSSPRCDLLKNNEGSASTIVPIGHELRGRRSDELLRRRRIVQTLHVHGGGPRADAKASCWRSGEKTGVKSIVGSSVTLEGFPPRARSNTCMSVVPARLSNTSVA